MATANSRTGRRSRLTPGRSQDSRASLPVVGGSVGSRSSTVTLWPPGEQCGGDEAGRARADNDDVHDHTNTLMLRTGHSTGQKLLTFCPFTETDQWFGLGQKSGGESKERDRFHDYRCPHQRTIRKESGARVRHSQTAPIGLPCEADLYSCQRLNRLLADSQMLYSLYKKHHWMVAGSTFSLLHELLDKHAGEQLEAVDTLAERIRMLGGVTVGDSRHAAEITVILRPSDGAEEVPATRRLCGSEHHFRRKRCPSHCAPQRPSSPGPPWWVAC
ncbi:Dps family protein [Streptosporangium sp. G11]|uniref:Dps family protein n=1 Tax=Streptosporangium sp. G11 TaxID=3436926 RepID=UPI003EBB04A6